VILFKKYEREELLTATIHFCIRIRGSDHSLPYLAVGRMIAENPETEEEIKRY
jgi:hypothetical protein